MSSVPEGVRADDGATTSPRPNATSEVSRHVSAEGDPTTTQGELVENAVSFQREQEGSGAPVPAATSPSPQPAADTNGPSDPFTVSSPVIAPTAPVESDSTILQETTATSQTDVAAEHVTSVTIVEASTFCQEHLDIGQPSAPKRPRSPTPPSTTSDTTSTNISNLQREYVIEATIKEVGKELNNVLKDCGMLIGSVEAYNKRFEPDAEQIRNEVVRRLGAQLRDIADAVEFGMTQTWAKSVRSIIDRYSADMRRDLIDEAVRRACSVKESVLARAANPSPTPPHFPEPEPETPPTSAHYGARPRSRSPSPTTPRSPFPRPSTPSYRGHIPSSAAGPSTPTRSGTKRQASSSNDHLRTPVRRKRFDDGDNDYVPNQPATPTKPPSFKRHSSKRKPPAAGVFLNRNLLAGRIAAERRLMAQSPTRAGPSTSASGGGGGDRSRVVGRLGNHLVMTPLPQGRKRRKGEDREDASAEKPKSDGDDDVDRDDDVFTG
ncbi:hypothetical protein GGS26DRAFT_604960 [Hypomontagnella submonticulosa]|nr:hypothetical protein GGS26DRAFT_604960 [Hypomontagnella submonticulosa]